MLKIVMLLEKQDRIVPPAIRVLINKISFGIIFVEHSPHRVINNYFPPDVIESCIAAQHSKLKLSTLLVGEISTSCFCLLKIS